jgi:hypothetical protein
VSIRSDLKQYAGDLSEFDDSVLGRELGVAANMAYHQLPDQVLLEKTYPVGHLNVGAETLNAESKTIIAVLRKDGNGAEKVCIEINPLLYDEQIQDASIYQPTVGTPGYTVKEINNLPILHVFPVVTGLRGANHSAKVYWRPTISNWAEYLDASVIPYFPDKGIYWLTLNTAAQIVHLKMNDAIMEDEDMELVQLLTMSLQAIKGRLDAESRRLNIEESAAFNELALEQIANPAKGRKPTER